MQVKLSWTAPAFRADGVTPLTLAEIQGFTVLNNGSNIGTVAGAVAGTQSNTFTDPAPNVGSPNAYTVETLTTDGAVSAPSNEFDITISPPTIQAAAAVADLTGVAIPDAVAAPAPAPLTNAQISARNQALINAGKPIPK